MDDRTHIEHFNHYLKLFVENTIETFPELKETLIEYYKPLLEAERSNEDKYVKRYMRKMRPFKDQISQKDETMFNEKLCVLKNVDFMTIFKSEELSSSNKTKIWEYIQTLYVLGDTIIATSDKVKDMLTQLQSSTGENGNEDEALRKMMESLMNRSEETAGELPFDENFLKNSSIGKLAAELSEEFNPQEFLGNLTENANPEDIMKNFMSGDNSMNFMNLFEKIGNKIKNKVESGDFDHERLLQDAQSMMGNLQNSGLGGLMGNLGNIAQFTQDNASSAAANPTQERLRRKLEQRKNKN
jgi:hypothetical protein